MLGNHFHIFILFFAKKKHENQTFRASHEPQGPRDRACAIDLEKKLQKNGNEPTLRPNGPPVMPVLRSSSTVKQKALYKRHGVVTTKTPIG